MSSSSLGNRFRGTINTMMDKRSAMVTVSAVFDINDRHIDIEANYHMAGSVDREAVLRAFRDVLAKRIADELLGDVTRLLI